MKRFVEGEDRKQATLLPECLDDYIAEDNPVRVIDVFIEVYAPSPHLLLFGGDHIAIPLTHYAKELGFRVTIVELKRASTYPKDRHMLPILEATLARRPR